MRKRKKPRKLGDSPLRPEEWIKLPIGDGGEGSGYAKAYHLILKFFATHPMNWENAVLGLHIVYGWMPTIPDLDRIMAIGENEEKRATLLASLHAAQQGLVEGKQLEPVVSFCNNSFVGASKLLHFLNPKVYPIWDLRVAKAFLKPRKKLYWSQVNDVKLWEKYQHALSGWADDQAVKNRCNKLRNDFADLEGAGDLRVIEWVLFQSVPSRRRARNRRAKIHPIEPP
jgi:hypothetical protein